jgi:hypothetical protein
LSKESPLFKQVQTFEFLQKNKRAAEMKYEKDKFNKNLRQVYNFNFDAELNFNRSASIQFSPKRSKITIE